MKKITITLITIFLFASHSFSQNKFKIGIKGGAEMNFYSPSEQFTPAFPNVKVTIETPKFSPYLGAEISFNFNEKLFAVAQPVLHFSQTTTKIGASDSGGPNNNAFAFGSTDKTMFGIKLPLLAGFNISKKLSIKAGPSFYLFTYYSDKTRASAHSSGSNSASASANYTHFWIFKYINLLNTELSLNLRKSQLSLNFGYESKAVHVNSNFEPDRVSIGLSFTKFIRGVSK